MTTHLPSGIRTSHRAMHYDVEVGGVVRRVELPFVIGVLADLSGDRQGVVVAHRRFEAVDADGFDWLVASVQPRLSFPVANLVAGEGKLDIGLAFTSMDDFAPAKVLEQVAALRALRDVRAAMGTGTDELLHRQLGLVLHHPAFQDLEGTWRGLHRLVTRTERCDEVRFRVLDISKRDLGRTLKKFRGTAWDQSPIFRMLNDEGPAAGEPFGLLVGAYWFDHAPSDVALLGDMAQLAAAVDAPFVAAAAPSLLQMETWLELPNPRDLSKIFWTPEYAAWRSLRESVDAHYLVLTLTRYAARPCFAPEEGLGDEYQFREEVVGPEHVTWGNPAFLLAENAARSFLIHGWCSHVSGLAGGGLVEDLPEVATGGEGPASTETRIARRREGELRRNGLTALVARPEPGQAEFVGAVMLGKPARTPADGMAEEAGAFQLSHVMVVCRVAHYVRFLVADGLLPLTDRPAAQAWFDAWIAEYVEPEPGAPDAFSSAPRPLAKAELAWTDHSVTVRVTPNT